MSSYEDTALETMYIGRYFDPFFKGLKYLPQNIVQKTFHTAHRTFADSPISLASRTV
jgi:hypothetical protein